MTSVPDPRRVSTDPLFHLIWHLAGAKELDHTAVYSGRGDHCYTTAMWGGYTPPTTGAGNYRYTQEVEDDGDGFRDDWEDEDIYQYGCGDTKFRYRDDFKLPPNTSNKVISPTGGA